MNERYWTFFVPFAGDREGGVGGGVYADTLDQAVENINAYANGTIDDLDNRQSVVTIFPAGDPIFTSDDLTQIQCHCCGLEVDRVSLQGELDVEEMVELFLELTADSENIDVD